MRTLSCFALFLIILVLALLPRAERTPTTIHWAPSYSAAMQEASGRRTLIMVDLYTDW